MHADLAHLCAEHHTLDTDEVANIEQALEHDVVHILVLLGADVIAGDIHLDAALRVLQLHERSLTHHAAAHQTACDRYLARLVLVLELLFYIGRKSVGHILCGRIGLDAHGTQFVQTIASDNLLFTKFQYVHFFQRYVSRCKDTAFF